MLGIILFIVALVLLVCYRMCNPVRKTFKAIMLTLSIILGLSLCCIIILNWSKDWGFALIISIATVFIFFIKTDERGEFSPICWIVLAATVASWVIPPLIWFYDFLFS